MARWPFRRTGGTEAVPAAPVPAVPAVAAESAPPGPAAAPAAPAYERPRADWARLSPLRPAVSARPPLVGGPAMRLPDVATTRSMIARPAPRAVPLIAPLSGQVTGLARPRPAAPAAPPAAPEHRPPAPAPVPARRAQPVPLVGRPNLTQAAPEYVGEPREPENPHRAPGWLRQFTPSTPSEPDSPSGGDLFGDLPEIPGLILPSMPITTSAPKPDEARPIVDRSAGPVQRRNLAASRRLGLGSPMVQRPGMPFAPPDIPDVLRDGPADDVVTAVPAGERSVLFPPQVDQSGRVVEQIGPARGAGLVHKPAAFMPEADENESPFGKMLRERIEAARAAEAGASAQEAEALAAARQFAEQLAAAAAASELSAQAAGQDADRASRESLSAPAPVRDDADDDDDDTPRGGGSDRRPGPTAPEGPSGGSVRPAGPVTLVYRSAPPDPSRPARPAPDDDGPRQVVPVRRIETAPQSVVAAVAAAHGVDTSAVRIHRGPSVSSEATSMGARAFTRGRQVHLPDEAGPLESPAVRGLVAHELVHVIQQQALGSALPSESSELGQALEEQALAVEEAVTTGRPVQPLLRAPVLRGTVLPNDDGDDHEHEPWLGEEGFDGGAARMLSVSAPVQRAGTGTLPQRPTRPGGGGGLPQRPTRPGSGGSDDGFDPADRPDSAAGFGNFLFGGGSSGGSGSSSGNYTSWDRGSSSGSGSGQQQSNFDPEALRQELREQRLQMRQQDAEALGQPAPTSLSSDDERAVDNQVADAGARAMRNGSGSGTGTSSHPLANGRGGAQDDGPDPDRPTDAAGFAGLFSGLGGEVLGDLFGYDAEASTAAARSARDSGRAPRTGFLGALDRGAARVSGALARPEQRQDPAADGTGTGTGSGDFGGGGDFGADGGDGVGAMQGGVLGPVVRTDPNRPVSDSGRPQIDTDDLDLDEIADRIYDRVRSKIRTELLVDRERSGMLTDFR